MTAPGVGYVTALTFKAGVDDPPRFKHSRTVAAHFGLTPRRFQSGELDLEGHISRCGDASVRSTLYTAANAMLTRSSKWSSLKAWGMKLAKTRGHRRAVIAVARKLAVILHRMWIDDTQFRWGTEAARS
jgi:transposase